MKTAEMALVLVVACGTDGAAPSLPDAGLPIAVADAATDSGEGGDGQVIDAAVSMGTDAFSDASQPPAKRPFDWVQLISTGQSLSVGSQGLPASTLPQPYQNMKLFDSSPWPNYDDQGDNLLLKSCPELPSRGPFPVETPRNSRLQTMAPAILGQHLRALGTRYVSRGAKRR
jgi:hypothetical protein